MFQPASSNSSADWAEPSSAANRKKINVPLRYRLLKKRIIYPCLWRVVPVDISSRLRGPLYEFFRKCDCTAAGLNRTVMENLISLILAPGHSNGELPILVSIDSVTG